MILIGHKLDESKLSDTERDNLNKSEFGIPETRSYPMPDKNHVRSAISYFSKCPSKYKSELAKNIQKKAKQYGWDLKDSEVIGKYL